MQNLKEMVEKASNSEAVTSRDYVIAQAACLRLLSLLVLFGRLPKEAIEELSISDNTGPK